MNVGDSPTAIDKYVDSLGLTLRIYIDTEGRLSVALGISNLPATVFVDRNGQIADVHFGVLSAAELDAGVAKLMAG